MTILEEKGVFLWRIILKVKEKGKTSLFETLTLRGTDIKMHESHLKKINK